MTRNLLQKIMDKHEQKAEYLVDKMGNGLALRFVNANISHWEEDELILARTESKDYWVIVKSYLSKFTNCIIRS